MATRFEILERFLGSSVRLGFVLLDNHRAIKDLSAAYDSQDMEKIRKCTSDVQIMIYALERWIEIVKKSRKGN